MNKEQLEKAVNGSMQIAAEQDPEFSAALMAWLEAHSYTENMVNFMSRVIGTVLVRLK